MKQTKEEKVLNSSEIAHIVYEYDLANPSEDIEYINTVADNKWVKEQIDRLVDQETKEIKEQVEYYKTLFESTEETMSFYMDATKKALDERTKLKAEIEELKKENEILNKEIKSIWKI